MAQILAGDIRKGVTFEYKSGVYTVTDFQHVKPGKGAAFVRTTLKNVVNAGKGGNYYEIKRPEDVEKVVFGSIADEVGDVIISADSRVNIVRYNDEIVYGFEKIPNVSTFIISMETYDAIVPLTINYLKPGGYTEMVPLYAYRSHGNGKVSSFTSDFSGGWTSSWTENDKDTFIKNMLDSNTPKVRHALPFSVKDIELTDKEAYIEVEPSIPDPEAKTTLKIKFPPNELGKSRTITRELPFDSKKYGYTIDLAGTGLYTVEVTYQYNDKKYVTVETFEVPYLEEYNAFAPCDKAVVHKFMRGEGGIYEGEIPNLEYDDSEISTYQENYKIPLLIAAVCVFVADILVRKLTFGKRKAAKIRKGEKK